MKASILGVAALSILVLLGALPVAETETETRSSSQATMTTFTTSQAQSGQTPSVSLLQTSLQQTTSAQSPAGYILVAPMSALNSRTSAYFNHPSQGLSLLVSLGSQWKAFSATCTHQPCTVQYSGSQIQCPCHGGVFNADNGSVVSGPPPTRLPEFGVIIQNGNLYVSNSVIN